MNKYETLKKRILKNPDYQTKRKLVKTLKKDILKKSKDIKIEAMQIGVETNKIFVIINTNFLNAQKIRETLNIFFSTAPVRVLTLEPTVL